MATVPFPLGAVDRCLAFLKLEGLEINLSREKFYCLLTVCYEKHMQVAAGKKGFATVCYKCVQAKKKVSMFHIPLDIQI